MIQPIEKVLEQKIIEAIKARLDDAREVVIAKAISEFEKEIRRAVGNSVINLLEWYSVERIGSELVIHVKIEKGEK